MSHGTGSSPPSRTTHGLPSLRARRVDDRTHDAAHAAQTAHAARALWRIKPDAQPHLPSDGPHGRIDAVADRAPAVAPTPPDLSASPVPYALSSTQSAPATPTVPFEPLVTSAPSVQMPNALPESLSSALPSSTRWTSPPRRDMTAAAATSHDTVSAPDSRGAPPDDEAARLATLRRYDILDTPPEPAFERIVRLASHGLGAPISLVSLIDESRQWFKARQGIDTVQTPRSMAFCAHAILGDEVLVVPDARADRRFADNPMVTGEPNIRFYAGAPLRTPEGHRLGTLCVMDRRPRTLDDEKRALLADLSAITVDALELRRVNRILGDMAMRDGLTGVLNRRALLMQADRVLAASRASQRRLSVLMLDIDHFKTVNDTWGHAIGDRVLVELTLVLRATLRKGTIIGRLGGEEFAVLLPEADAHRAVQAAERVLAAIGSASVPGPNGPVRFTASIGVGSLAPDDADFSSVLQRADRALYAAKQAGRNRVAAL